MVGYYRLKEFDYALAAGAHILPRSEFAAIEQANRLIADAEAAAAELRYRAELSYQSETRRGYEDGLVEARIRSVGQLIEESRTLDVGLVAIERDLSRLVVECVRKLVDGFDDFARAEALVKAALRQMRREKSAELRVSPHLHAHFRERIAAILHEFPEVQLVDLVEDPTLQGSRIILETGVGRIDGNIAERFAELEAVIRSAHAKAAADVLDALSNHSDASNEIRP
ncbi:type III secretion system stator protein SctL [Bradyrhizobium sp. TM239]|uniref:type III secretion system stator protein SctL n=1 Tax=Bradyrhizobium sp. TM239 TaxID=2599802 RepID=UPI0027D4D8BF|nr:SctL family type III secretion system stator protein VscL [Bradyrhizobium sp. TM239]